MGSATGATTGTSLAIGTAAILPITGTSMIWTAVIVAALLTTSTALRVLTRGAKSSSDR